MIDDSKAVVAARPFLEADEILVGAFFGETGPKPGVEAFSVLVFAATLLLTSNYIAALVLGSALYAGVILRRRHVLVALTDHGLLQIRCGLRRVPRQAAPVTRLGVRSNLLFADAGDPFATVQGRKIWVRGPNQDEARRLSRLVSGNGD